MEYLSPGVYLEEVSSGNKPIEGASTSTAGMVGVTHRGPVNAPALVTSFGEFQRLFGGILDHRTFTEHRDALPYAVEGFFNNGGQRLYVSRIIGPTAGFSSTDIYAPPVADGARTTLTERAVAGTNTLTVNDETNLAIDDQILLIDDIRSEYVQVAAVEGASKIITLVSDLNHSHATEVAAVKQVPLLRVRARDQGLWGNSVRVRVNPTHLLETAVSADAGIGDTVVVLDGLFGLTTGSYVEFRVDADTLQSLQVQSVNRANNEATLTRALEINLPATTAAVSKEYNLIVERLKNDKVVQAELFENLGLHPTHTRYGPKIVGSYNRGTGINTVSGESELVRLSDLTVDDDGVDIAVLAANRASTFSDQVPRPMQGGTDDLVNINDLTYVGSSTPGALSGIHSLENEESISMVAVPGRAGVSLQKALIGHCQKMRFRFAVLDTPRGLNPGQAITHRRNYDTTQAAVYYPWLVTPDLFGERGDLLHVPPAGHVMGIYARTDSTRGVWKAPANEVVRGILQFERVVTMGEQDLLNPAHVNAFRDFRTANRGLRLWGARTLSSDPEWKYINVRRLCLFLEQSIERGMHFAVFEPNNETLWATVKQSIGRFLVGVWRDGGLEGVTAEKAFYVRVGYNVTMTQTDIDNGRLIAEVGVAPLRPAEFVIMRISQKTREAVA